MQIQTTQKRTTGMLSDKAKQRQKNKASAFMVIRFKPGGNREKFSIWSDEAKKPHIKTIEDAIKRMKWLFEKYWQANAQSAAIFDMREYTNYGVHNKILQYQDGEWIQIMEF